MLIKAQLKKATWYEPAFGDNRKVEPENRARFLLKPMTNGEFEALRQANLSSRNISGIGDLMDNSLRNEILKANVLKCENANLEDEEGEVVIPKDGAEFVTFLTESADGEFDGLLQELFAAIRTRSVLTEGMVKK